MAVRLFSSATVEALRTHLNSRTDSLELMRVSWSRQLDKTIFVPELVRPINKKALALAQQEQLKPGDLILNVGCGNGELDRELRREGFHAEGLDIVKHPQADEEHFKEGSAEQLPYANGKVKMYVSVFALPYTNMEKSTQEMRRVLPSGAKAMIVLHHPDQSEHAFKASLTLPPWESMDAYVRAHARELVLHHYPIARLLASVFPAPEAANMFFSKRGFKVVSNEELKNSYGHNSGYCIVLEKKN